ncbi:MAG TPA: ribonuclease P protein component [Candidatus Sulfotelmatobacter sp.]|nr:ribonuclease P protein component [Candidatus Sulfotelmatobacter sp.]
MSDRHPERLAASNRLRSSREHAAVRAGATAHRGRFCLLLSLAAPGEQTKLGFLASRRGVGNAVQRNRARRRLREIVRRRWPRIPATGLWLEFVASAGVLAATHQELASEVERLLTAAGALAPLESPGR